MFLGILLVLVGNAEALKCVMKGDITTANKLARDVAPFVAAPDSKINVKIQEECDGMCISVAKMEGNVTEEAAGCQSASPSATEYALFLSLNMKLSGTGSVWRYVVCNSDNCNAAEHPHHATMMNILNAVQDQTANLDKPPSAALKCHNAKGASANCSGYCSIHHEIGSISMCETKTGIDVQYQTVVRGTAMAGAPLQLIIAVGCSTDNCNSPGAVGQQALQNIQNKVTKELSSVKLRSSGNVPLPEESMGMDDKLVTSTTPPTTTNGANNPSYGFVLALFISIILATVDL